MKFRTTAISFMVIFSIMSQSVSAKENPKSNMVSRMVSISKEQIHEPLEQKVYTEYSIPEGNSTFKAYMDYRTITDKTSQQYKLQQQSVTDENGLRKFDEMYIIALGTHYTNNCGDIFRITFDGGGTIDCIVGDVKQNIHTDKTNRYSKVNDDMINIVEFIVDEELLCEETTIMGDVSFSNDILIGSVISICKVDLA